MGDLFKKAVDYIQGTKIPEQMSDVDYMGLIQNPWFIIPFVIIVLYMLYKKEFAFFLIMVVCIAIWFSTGTEYMSSLIVGGEIQVGKILPIVFGGAVALIAIIYLALNRD